MANVWFDTAASPYLYQPEIYRLAIETAGVDKILLGSDFPLLKPERYIEEMARAGLSEAQQNAICGSNAAKLLGLR